MDWLTFLHSSDFLLDQPLLGPPDPPPELARLLVQAPYEAATAVFDHAIEHQGDFVVLAGGLGDWLWSGPRGPLFLAEQFRELEESGIRVYWAAAEGEGPEHWPRSVPLPGNVHVFPDDQVQALAHRRHEKTVATVVGLSRRGGQKLRAEAFRLAEAAEPVVAVVHASAQAHALQQIGHHYWALGSQVQGCTLYCGEQAARFCGSPQPRHFQHQGAGTCTLVHMTPAGDVACQELPTAAALYRQCVLRSESLQDLQALETAFLEAMQTLEEERLRVPVLVRWVVSTAPGETHRLWHPEEQRRLLKLLWDWGGRLDPPVWAVELVPGEFSAPVEEPLEELPLAQQLRRQLASAGQEPALLQELLQLAPEQHAPSLEQLLHSVSHAPRQVRQEAQLLALDLLSKEWRQ